ncbi:multidrug efflux SMR transporter [Synechococcus sp. LA31]|jgi:small multidrug resistance pump|uniref:DMT family transporter n=1 Tax=Synechococcus sp. LA31 TaxID=2741953 RepID=UPI001BDBD7A2|nr:multidrug efflux SMR transporter [Synechococcus sp. LA31]QVV66516.1 multidrug efflux SMR transporter [Synechococcus sp. LA31]
MPTAPVWLVLLLAIASEVVGTSCLKLSAGMTRPMPTLVVLAAYGCSMLLLSKVVQTIPLGVTYALWSGIGIVAIVLVGLLAYRQVPSHGQLVGMALITAGVVMVNLTGQLHE